MIRIHKASLRDCREISELLQQKYYFSSLEEARSVFVHEYKHKHHLRVACVGNSIVGMVSWRPERIVQYGVVELTRIAVLKTLPNLGEVRESLFGVMIAEADFYYKKHNCHLRKVYSMIRADNNFLKEFFIDKGMQQEAVLKDHFHRGENELVFSLFFT